MNLLALDRKIQKLALRNYFISAKKKDTGLTLANASTLVKTTTANKVYRPLRPVHIGLIR